MNHLQKELQITRTAEDTQEGHKLPSMQEHEALAIFLHGCFRKGGKEREATSQLQKEVLSDLLRRRADDCPQQLMPEMSFVSRNEDQIVKLQ